MNNFSFFIKQGFFALCVVSSVFCGEGENSPILVIPGASYYVQTSQESASFYSFDGNFIKTVEYPAWASGIEARLDSSAPKPRPVACEVSYWKAFPVYLGGIRVATKGVPGDMIIFFDKKGNEINRFRYDRTTGKIKIATCGIGQKGLVSYGKSIYKAEDFKGCEDFPLDVQAIRSINVGSLPDTSNSWERCSVQ